MKKLLMVITAGIMALGLTHSKASAATIDLGTLTTSAGISLPALSTPTTAFGSISETYQFVASTAGTLTFDLLTGVFPGSTLGTPTVALYDSSLNPVSLSLTTGTGVFEYSSIVAGAKYYLGFLDFYSGHVSLGGTLSLAATPIPPALLMFVTALGGLGFVGFRKRNLAA